MVGECEADTVLLARFADSGEARAFEEIFQRHGNMVLNTCRRILNDDLLAEDAAQAVFLILVRKARALKTGVVLSGWLYRTAVFVSLRLKRTESYRQKHERAASALTWDIRTESDGASHAEREALLRSLDECLADLPENYRNAVVLRYLEGLSEAEVSRQLGCAVGTVSSRTARGIERLQAGMRKRRMVVSLTAIAGILTAQAAEAVPANFLESTTSACLGKAGGSRAIKMLAEEAMKAMVWMKIKTAATVFGVVLVFGVCIKSSESLRAGEGASAAASKDLGPDLTAAPKSFGELKAANGNLEERAYTLKDIVQLSHQELTPQVLADLIRSQVRPADWDAASQTYIQEVDGKLVVMQEPKVHKLIEAILTGLWNFYRSVGTVEVAGKIPAAPLDQTVVPKPFFVGPQDEKTALYLRLYYTRDLRTLYPNLDAFLREKVFAQDFQDPATSLVDFKGNLFIVQRGDNHAKIQISLDNLRKGAKPQSTPKAP